MDMLRIGMIGAGDVAVYAHMPSFAANPRVRVEAIADPNIKLAQGTAEKFRIPLATPDYRVVLEDPHIDVVDVCAPHYLHYRIVMDALRAGKDVICEKPLAMGLDEADDMINTANELGRRLLVVLNQRYLPIHRKIKEYIVDGRLGTPFLANGWINGDVMARLNDATNWKGTWDLAGGGALFDTGTHIVDLMRYWFGMPTSVSAIVRRLVATPENKADDNASVILEYDDQMLANVTVSYSVTNEAWSEKKFIYGTGGDISAISEASVPMFYVSNGAPQLVEVEHNPAWAQWSHNLALTDLVNSLLQGTEPLVSVLDARETLRIILAAYESSASGCKVVL